MYIKKIITTAVALSTFSLFTMNVEAQPKMPRSHQVPAVAAEENSMEKEFKEFADKLEKECSLLYHNSALASYDASLSGKDEDFKTSADADMSMNKFFSNKDYFKQLKKFKESNQIKNEILSRRLIMLFNSFAPNQIDIDKLNNITMKQNDISKKFQNFRAVIGDKKLTDNEIEEILQNSKNSDELKDAWMAHKKIGLEVSRDIIELVKMRNEAAKELGYKNYHEMSLSFGEQNPDDILKIFDELDGLTRDAFANLKKEIDTYLAKRDNINVNELMPWHFQNRYFQEAPKIYDVDLDKYYKNQNVVDLTTDYYKSIGLDITDIIKRSDLYEKPGKYQHAYCTDVDRDAHDIRVVCNVKQNSSWMNTMLHEFGHGVYSKYHSEKLPWILKTAAHTFTTEAIAMMFGRLASNPAFMVDMKIIDSKDAKEISDICDKYLRLEQLCFSRWSQVMYRFEKSMYENPDQDLNKLWWDLVEKYQMMKRPAGRNAPDWASKIHLANVPCYYHNYHLGELLASQLYFTIKDKILHKNNEKNVSFYGSSEAGKFLLKNVFEPGAMYDWNTMIEKATGEKLTAKYYAKQFVK